MLWIIPYFADNAAMSAGCLLTFIWVFLEIKKKQQDGRLDYQLLCYFRLEEARIRSSRCSLHITFSLHAPTTCNLVFPPRGPVIAWLCRIDPGLWQQASSTSSTVPCLLKSLLPLCHMLISVVIILYHLWYVVNTANAEVMMTAIAATDKKRTKAINWKSKTALYERKDASKENNTGALLLQ